MIRLFLHRDFTLPMLGKDVFARLMRAGVEYDKASRSFRIKDGADMASILAILREAVREEVSIELQCIVCGDDAGCAGCEFSSNCDRVYMASKCICKQCLEKGYENYTWYLSSLFDAARSDQGRVRGGARKRSV